ncbi:MAG TPA: ATP-dependent 6-phosphofructokinase [Thermodesulfobacteriota bacterium]|nr:ATP-dependent 6-phosphofructokinase [Thermodesulfobacteriota bacterium]
MVKTIIHKIGILTGGGDCPGLNAVIRAVVKTAVLQHGWKVMGIEDGFEGLLVHGKVRPLLLDHVKDILDKGGTILGSSNRANPFEYKFKENGKIITEDRSPILIENLRSLEIDALVVIGGDGSLSIADRLSKTGIQLVGVPKTIDNDLAATDITFGFDTAINTATEAIDKIRTTGESHHRVMVVEVMGRYAGWIALEAGIASGADIILIPEIPFHFEKVCHVIRERAKIGRHHSIVVIAEGAKPHDGDMYVKRIQEDSVETIRLGGIGEMLANKISDELGIESRETVLGHIQRGGSPSAFDRILSTRLGFGAVNLLAQGRFGRMVCLKTPVIDSVLLEEAVKQLKQVDIGLDMVQAAKSIGVSFGD